MKQNLFKVHNNYNKVQRLKTFIDIHSLAQHNVKYKMYSCKFENLIGFIKRFMNLAATASATRDALKGKKGEIFKSRTRKS